MENFKGCLRTQVDCEVGESPADCHKRQEQDAALLTTCYCARIVPALLPCTEQLTLRNDGADVPFTITRFSGFILSRHFTSIQLFRIGFVGATLSLCAIGFADSPTALWTGTAIFGMCCGTGSPFPAL